MAGINRRKKKLDLDALLSRILNAIDKDVIHIEVEQLAGKPIPPEYTERLTKYGRLVLQAKELDYKMAKDAEDKFKNMSDAELQKELDKLAKDAG